MSKKSFVQLLLATAVLTVTGCGFDERHRLVTPFVLACDGEGDTYDPELETPVDAGNRIDGILRAVGAEFERYEAEAKQAGRTAQRRRILIHIHGGLNSRSASLGNAYRAFLRMRKETGDDHCVPIFVTWESGLFESYIEHLTKLRNGRHQKKLAWLSSPIWLVSDVAAGVVDTPRSLITRLVSDVALGYKVPTDVNLLPSWDYADQNYARIREAEAGKPPSCLLGEYSRGALVQGLRFVWYLVTLAPSVVVTALAIDGPGTAAWDAMRHRAANLNVKYGEFKSHGPHAEGYEATGAVAQLIRKLRAKIEAWQDEHPDQKYEVVLVGHSMGTIVLNDTLHELMHRQAEFPTEKPLPVSRIVYMAAACSTQEALRAVVPYVERRPETKFHVLTLHPMAEVDEQNALDFAPRGSLLEWLDNWYTSPATPVERRFGKWVNLLQAIPLFHRIEKRMTVKGFGVDGDCIPQKHGQFNHCPYWRESCWSPSGPMKYPARWDDLEEGGAQRF